MRTYFQRKTLTDLRISDILQTVMGAFVMAKVSTNINLDASLKKSAQELFADLGMDLTTAVTLFLKQSLREQGIPFAIKRDSADIADVSRRQD